MLNFNEYESMITEGFVIKDNTLYFDPKGGDFIKTSFGKSKKLKPYHKSIENGIVYSVYKEVKVKDRKLKDEVLRTIKGQSTVYDMDYNSYRKFISRTAIFMADLIRKEEADLILVMDSSSPLVTDLQIEINKRLPKYYDMFTYHKQIFKNPDFSEIEIDWGDANLNDSNIKTMKSTLKKLSNKGHFKISKFYGSRRKFIKNWLKMRNNILHKIIDKKVVLLDDFLTSGSTMIEAGRLLNDAGVEKIIGLTIAKDS